MDECWPIPVLAAAGHAAATWRHGTGGGRLTRSVQAKTNKPDERGGDPWPRRRLSPPGGHGHPARGRRKIPDPVWAPGPVSRREGPAPLHWVPAAARVHPVEQADRPSCRPGRNGT